MVLQLTDKGFVPKDIPISNILSISDDNISAEGSY
jgi:hypothetical protein